MSIKKLAAACGASISALLPLTPAFAESAECNAENISGRITLTYLQGYAQSGAIPFNPGQEIVARVDCGARLSVNLSYDIRANEPYDYDGGRIETASLTYRAGDLQHPWSITAGRLGEQRRLEALFGGPGGRPDAGARNVIVSLRADNPDIAGLRIQKSFAVSDEWNLSLDGSAFAATEVDTGLGRVADRANSHDPSFTVKATLSRGAYRFGVETGHIENGPSGDSAENYVGVFARFSEPINDTLTWAGVAEIIDFNNHANIAGQDRTLGVAYSHLEWQPQGTRLALWGQLGLNIDSENDDMGFVEFGVRYDVVQSGDSALSLFAAVSMRQSLEGNQRTDLDPQIGFRLRRDF